MPTEQELVCYVFVHDHLSTVQKGIQAAHAVAGLFSEEGGDSYANFDSVNWGYTKEWVEDHKTILLCQGGNSQQLSEVVGTISQGSMPYASFYEDDETLNSMLTAVAIVLPKLPSIAVNNSKEWSSMSDADRRIQGLCITAKLVVT